MRRASHVLSLVLLAAALTTGCERREARQRGKKTVDRAASLPADCATAADCEDDNPCTEHACVEMRCKKAFLPNGTSCDNGTVCDGVARCDGRGRCLNGAPPQIDDGNACTTDTCDPVKGVSHVAVDVDDLDACTTDSCDPRTGEIAHVTVDIDDGDDCTFDSCDPKQGVQHRQANSFHTCQGGCGAGFRAASRSPARECGSEKALRTFCAPACGNAFYTCDGRCPDGYHTASRVPSSQCGPGSLQLFCQKSSGGSFYSCDGSCPARYKKRSEITTDQCGAPGSTKILCIADG